jgi:hypothetical protein
MKPRAFIASSAEGIDLANAIQSNLHQVAHSKVWSQGVFGLSGPTTASLLREVRDSDFGIFVFTPDDTSEIRGKNLSVPRDNVVFELGLFSGELGTDRCFFLVPMGSHIHLPSDLLGLTSGLYDPGRPADEWQAVVGPFSTAIINVVREKGRRTLDDHELAIAYAAKYDARELVLNETERVRIKDSIFTEMKSALRQRNISKWRLIGEQTIGFYVAFAATVIGQPELADVDLILSIEPSTVTRGNVQHRLLDAIELLDTRSMISGPKKAELHTWMATFPNPDTSFIHRLGQFKI